MRSFRGECVLGCQNGVVKETRPDPNYASSFFSQNWPPNAIGQVYLKNSDSDWPFEMADFRTYDREIADEEIER